MTNEQAKDLLDNLIGMVEDNQEHDYDTALKMGIKALDKYAEPSETCEDCEHPCIMYEPKMKACERKHECEDAIGRQASLNTIESMYQKCDGDLQTFHDLLVDCFEVLPSVQPKAKTGHWIVTYPFGKNNPIYECPCCKASNNSVFKDFCPNCGARMVDE